MIKSICIVRLSALGDVLMLVPMVRRLQAALPHVTITWVISRPAYDLVENMENVQFVVINKPNSLKDYWQFKKQLFGQSFDVLLACQASFRANLLYPLIKASRKIGYDRVRAKDGHHWMIQEVIEPGYDHTLEGFLKFAEVLGIQSKEIRWDLPVKDEDFSWARQHLPGTPFLLINPAASKPERSWLVDHYIEVIKQVKSRWGLAIVLTGGPGAYDRELANAILDQIPSCTDLVGKTKPKQLLAVIKQAELVLCPDTGPSHMAAAMNTPVIALHAVTSADVSGPYTFRHLAVDCYPEAIKTVLKKTSLTNRWGTHAHGKDTMKLVTVDAVMAKFESFFRGKSCK